MGDEFTMILCTMMLHTMILHTMILLLIPSVKI